MLEVSILHYKYWCFVEDIFVFDIEITSLLLVLWSCFYTILWKGLLLLGSRRLLGVVEDDELVWYLINCNCHLYWLHAHEICSFHEHKS